MNINFRLFLFLSTTFFPFLTQVLSNILSIEKRLKPLSPMNHSLTQIIIKNIEEKSSYLWTHHNDHLVKKITSNYIVKNKTHTSNRVTSTSFQKTDLKITQLFNVNDRSKQYQLAIVKYLGVLEETGYTKQDAILLKRN